MLTITYTALLSARVRVALFTNLINQSKVVILTIYHNRKNIKFKESSK